MPMQADPTIVSMDKSGRDFNSIDAAKDIEKHSQATAQSRKYACRVCRFRQAKTKTTTQALNNDKHSATFTPLAGKVAFANAATFVKKLSLMDAAWFLARESNGPSLEVVT